MNALLPQIFGGEVVQVPNQFPSLPTKRKIALIGESPGKWEEDCGKPFIGPSGKLLWALLRRQGIERENCFVGNLCQMRPLVGDKFETCDPDDLEAGLTQLELDLKAFGPNVVVLLGANPLFYAKNQKLSISKYRGSLFVGDVGPFNGLKCLPTYHPAFCLRAFRNSKTKSKSSETTGGKLNTAPAVLSLDLRRAISESEDGNLVLPSREITVCTSVAEFKNFVDSVINDPAPMSVDIEGMPDAVGITCIGFGTAANKAFVLPMRCDMWSVEEEFELWNLLKFLLESNKPKIYHNALYDTFVLAYRHGIVPANTLHDTMLLGWELYCEMEKSLKFYTSIFTKEPFYKDDRMLGAHDPNVLYSYNGRDCCCTMELLQPMLNEVKPIPLQHYQFNVSLLDPVLFAQLRGLKFDSTTAASMKAEITSEIASEQTKLNLIAGKEINPASTKQVPELLYNQLKLPTQYKVDPETKERRVTTDYEALLKLRKKSPHEAVECMIKLRNLLKKVQYVQMPVDTDGRIRSSFQICGTETGRMSSSTSSTGSGLNLQTIPDDIRRLIIKDDDYKEMFQVDLRGADGWTVACHAAAHGDPTMLEDLRYGLKPAKLLTLAMRKGEGIYHFDRAKLHELSREVGGNEQWDYFCSKKVQHGSSYGMQVPMMRLQIFQESEGKVDPTPAETSRMQAMFYLRYPGIKRWQDWVKRQLLEKGQLISPSGNVRKFFGRKDSHDTFKEALAQEPQNTTGFVTNMAMKKLWNKMEQGVEVEVLLQVHDAILGQHRLENIVPLVIECFNNPVKIAGIEVTIPFELKVGPNWGEMKEI